MIDDKELRKGNWYYDGCWKENTEVHTVDPYWVNSCGGNAGTEFKDCNGIPLTEEILLKCGFKLKTLPEKYATMGPIAYYEHTESKFKLGTQDGKFYVVRIYDSMSLYAISDSFDSLHELQNIYYWLSGKKELEVKL